MGVVKSFLAVFHGFRLCFFDPHIRRLAIWPWIIGGCGYIVAFIISYNIHSSLVGYFVNDGSGILHNLWLGLVWLGVTLFLFIASMLLSVLIVLVFGGIFQSSIALRVASSSGLPLPGEADGMRGTIDEAFRSIRTESVKLLWLLPLSCVALIVGFIPFLAPAALVVGAWLLAYQFVDIVLDIFKLSAKKRLRFAMEHWIPVVTFGLVLSLICFIPFVGLLIPPVAVAGAAWWMLETEWGKLKMRDILAAENIRTAR